MNNRGTVIPQGLASSLFEPFVRAGDSARGGLGLGLYIASEIAKAHHGTLEVHSSEADGTRVELRMPVTPA